MRNNKKILGILSIILCLNFLILPVKAEDSLGTENVYIGSTEVSARGVYLQSGISRISQIGSGMIRASGSTDAQRPTSVAVYVRVERLVNGKWEVYASWGASKTGTSITTYKDFTVPKGYYYRVACNHYAGPDASSSYTNGMFIN